jgi:hypothetical protein
MRTFAFDGRPRITGTAGIVEIEVITTPAGSVVVNVNTEVGGAIVGMEVIDGGSVPNRGLYVLTASSENTSSPK